MHGSFDYYNVLGIDHYATRVEIKQAYRRLAKKHHPDLNPNDPTAEDQFQKVNEAYETLYDSGKRKMYDTGFDQAVRTAYASGSYGASNARNSSAQNRTQAGYTQSGYGYTDFGAAEANQKFEDLSFSGKVQAYSTFALKNLPRLHFIILAIFGIFLLIMPVDDNLSLGQYTGISMRLTFFLTQAIFSSWWVERSCHNLKDDFMMLPTMLIVTHGASAIPSAIATVTIQILLGLPRYIAKQWSGVEVSDLNF